MKIGVKIATHLNTNVSAHDPHARYNFFDWKKNKAALSELILQSDGDKEVLHIPQSSRGMWSNSLLPSLPSPLWPRVVAPDWV